MPKRLLDGEALWSSTKVKKLPIELRFHYANWLPIAEANGVFEADVDIIRCKIYSFLRPDVCTENVQYVLTRFVEAGLVQLWVEEGKQWGYFIGMHKPGRLPSKSQLDRGDYRVRLGFPNPPQADHKATTSEPQADHKLGLGLGTGVGEGLGLEDELMSLRQRITDLARTKLRTRIPPDDKNWSEINSIARTEGQDAITEAFSTFCDERQGESIAYPLSQFIRVVDGFLDGSTVRKTDGKSEVLILDLVEMADGTGIIFDKKQSLAISKLLESYTAEDIKSAFREYFTPLDDFQLKQAAQKFTEGATQLLEMQKRRQKRAKEQEELLNSIANRERMDAEARHAEIERKAAEEESLIEDTL